MDQHQRLGLTDEDGQPTGRVAAMLLAVLDAHRDADIPLQVDWEDLDADGLRGVDVIRWIEAARLAANPDAQPARIAHAVGIVLKRTDDHYYMEYDRHAAQFQPFGGKIDPPDPTAEAALRRELFEEMHLAALPDAARLSLTPLDGRYTERILSPTYGIYTAYSFRYFHAMRMAFAPSHGQWISRAHLEAGLLPDGRSVSTIYQTALGWPLLDSLPPTEITP